MWLEFFEQFLIKILHNKYLQNTAQSKVGLYKINYATNVKA
jgi:hypothetical protein